MRRIAARLLIAIAVAAAGGVTAALLTPGGAAAGGQTPCGGPGSASTVTIPGDGDTCSRVDPPSTTTTTTTTTTTATTPIPTVTIPRGGSGTVQRPHNQSPAGKARPAATKPSTKPAKPAPKKRAGPTKAKPRLNGGTYVFPVYGPVSFTDTYGAPRSDTGWHHGDDIFAPLGAPVLAVADGTLFLVGWNQIGGNRLWLRDDAGNYFYYAHLAAFSPAAAAGARVKAGTLLGFVGDTGDARGTPPHLHFEVHPLVKMAFGYDGAVNPTPYLLAWQRLQRLHLTDSDVLLTTASGWAATVAAPSAGAQPGAILLQSSDISTSTGLDPRSVARALAPPTIDVRVRFHLQQTITHAPKPASFHLSAKARRQALKVESLDRGAALPPGFPGTSVWDTLSQCEAGGDWGADTANGFYGGLQFTSSTWLENGGGKYAPFANHASREQQIAIAQRVLQTQGWVAWPVCSVRIGVR